MKDKEKQFIKGWEDYQAEKKQEVDEIAKDICTAYCGKVACRKYIAGEYCDMCKTISKELLKKYQPKLPKDSVVLSREEYELMENELRDKIYQACKLEKQKTAEKIINHFVTEFPMLKTRVIARELAKQFGVEIKE